MAGPDEQWPAGGEPGLAGPAGDEVVPGVPPDADRRLHSGAFSAGLSVPAFAACLDLGLRPLSVVQGFCVMRWSWYGAQSPYLRGANPYRSQQRGQYAEVYNCPHGYVSGEHRMWGQNYEQPWVEAAWSQGFGTAYSRMLDEAAAAGAHGVIGVVDARGGLIGADVLEFGIRGTAVIVEGASPPPQIWTTYLAGQQLAKLIEAGFMPVSIAAGMVSVRVWAYCVTEYLMSGRGYGLMGGMGGMGGLGGGGFGGGALGNGGFTGGGFGGGLGSGSGSGGVVAEVDQLGRAHMAARSAVRSRLRAQIGADTLHGATMEVHEREVGEADREITCLLKGTRVRRFKDFDPLPAPVPTVTLR